MEYKCFGEKVRGYSHEIKDVECQDAFCVEVGESYLIVSVADGHGSSNCPHSAEGAQLATDIAVEVLRSVCSGFKDNYDIIKDELSLNIPKRIEQEWKKAVHSRHIEAQRGDSGNVHLLYGTTLLALILTENFIAVLQLGDGDVLCVGEDMETQRLIEANFLAGNYTDSLCQANAWANMRTFITRISESTPVPRLFLLSTDGYSNSFPDDGEFLKIGADYLSKLDEDEEIVRENLSDWLSETSKEGSGDDITLVLVYRGRME